MKVKRVTDPLDDEAKARLVGFSYSSTTSGSEHGGIDDNSDSPCLSDLLQSFYEDDDDHDTNESHVKSERIEFVSDDVEQQQLDDDENVIGYEGKSTFSNSNCSDMYENLLRFHVLKAIDVFTCLKSNRVMFRRNVMCYLRNVGYNAAICKSKWESSAGLTAGNYEYIDVVATTATTSTAVRNRYIIDIDFAAQFEIVRQTEQYSRKIQALPRVYIGRDDELKRVVKTMCDAARRSLKINELHFPPWRKNRYMMMKWFGSYRRSTNLIPANLSEKLPVVVQAAVKCQCVGFDTDINGRYFINTR